MNKIKNIIKEIVFPENLYCIACGIPIKKGNDYALCDECKEKLLYNQPASCRRCGKFTNIAAIGFCESCIAQPPVYDRGCVAMVYKDETRKIIHSLKYGSKGYLAKNIAYIVNGAIKNIGEYDIIVPVPMHKDKKRIRGFCQTTLIAKNLSQITGKELSENNLVRVKNTPPMSGLNTEGRKKNVKDAFKIIAEDEFAGKRVLLIDDILTTGSTADECSRILKNAGAKEVYLGVFASTYENVLS